VDKKAKGITKKPHLLLYINMYVRVWAIWKRCWLSLYPWTKIPILMVSMVTSLISWHMRSINMAVVRKVELTSNV